MHAAVASAHPQSQRLTVSVNDFQGGHEYPEVVRFEIEEQDLSSYLRAVAFLNISNVEDAAGGLPGVADAELVALCLDHGRPA